MPTEISNITETTERVDFVDTQAGEEGIVGTCRGNPAARIGMLCQWDEVRRERDGIDGGTYQRDRLRDKLSPRRAREIRKVRFSFDLPPDYPVHRFVVSLAPASFYSTPIEQKGGREQGKSDDRRFEKTYISHTVIIRHSEHHISRVWW